MTLVLPAQPGEMTYTVVMSAAYEEATLPNGIKVIAEITPDAHSAGIGFFVRTGSRDEEPRVMGVSHFLEHMMFKGTERRTAADVDREFDRIGAEHNAFTSTEMTAFWAHCLPEHLPQAEEILSDIMRPALRQEDFDAEKQVILEEIAMYQDNPFWVLYERTIEAFYATHPLSHRVLGTPETVGNLTRDEMLEYFIRRYSADNTVVALAGRVDFDAMVKRLIEHCGHWEHTNASRDNISVPSAPSEFTIDMPNVSQHYMLMIAPAPSMTDPRRYAASMLGLILGDVDGSRLYWSLVDTGIAEEAQAQYDGHDGAGTALTFAVCDPTDARRVQQIMFDECDALIDSLTEDDLERVRSKIATSVTLAGEMPAGRMRRLGRMRMYDDDYRSLESELERINAVTLDELRDVCRAFPWRPVTIGHLKPTGR